MERVSRSVYTLADALASTGGLLVIFVLFSWTILAVINFNRIENELASRLYWDDPQKLDSNR